MENQFSYIIAAVPTTTTIATRPVILSGITINTSAVTGVITVYDGVDATTGTVMAIITSSAATPGQVSHNFFDIRLKKGLTIVTSVAAQNLTVAYRPTA